MRMHYVFYSIDKTLKTFLQNCHVEIRITSGEKFEDPLICKTSGKIFRDFPNNIPFGNAFLEKKQMDMFDKDLNEQSSLTLMIGLSYDKLVASKDIKSSLTRKLDAYIPEDYYMTIDTMPSQ